MKVQTIGVLGAGAMGAGIAQVAAAHQFKVILRDMGEAQLNRARTGIEKSLNRQARAGKLNCAADEALKHIRFTEAMEDLAEADYLIEAIPERMSLKQEAFKALDALCRPGVILATNTSELSVTAIAAATKRPERVVGMHWFNPPPVMALIEVVRGVQTSDATIEETLELSKALGKETVVCKDAQGFITSRLLCAVLAEGYRIAEEGLASPADIDKAIRLGLNHPMGPLELSDYLGLDVLVHASEGLAQAFGDRFRLPQSVVKLVEAGHLGRKTGRGFYDYSK